MWMHAKPAVVLLSGGLDSATVLLMAAAQGFDTYAISYRYGQRHAFELKAAAQLAQRYGARRHVVVDFDLRTFGGSALTGDLEVPKHRSLEQIGQGVPPTYVPARNTIFLSFALAWAETLQSSDIFIGVNALDYSGYPDCRPQYIGAFQHMANMATRAGAEDGCAMTIHAPLIRMTKAQIIREGLKLGVDYGMTSSCYDPDSEGRPCEQCDACLLRAKGFAEAGAADPLLARVARPRSPGGG